MQVITTGLKKSLFASFMPRPCAATHERRPQEMLGPTFKVVGSTDYCPPTKGQGERHDLVRSEACSRPFDDVKTICPGLRRSTQYPAICAERRADGAKHSEFPVFWIESLVCCGNRE
jgi:hypothetical protein